MRRFFKDARAASNDDVLQFKKSFTITSLSGYLSVACPLIKLGETLLYAPPHNLVEIGSPYIVLNLIASYFLHYGKETYG
jgi:hypothetical protein